MEPAPAAETEAFALVNARVAVREGGALGLGPDPPAAVLIERGRIAHVGGDATVRGLLRGRGPAIDTGGAVVAPGIIDAHMHAFDCAVDALRVSCLPPAVDSLTSLRRRLADQAAARPAGGWVVATGYDDTRLDEHRHPTRLDIDAAVPDHPAVVGRVCGHMSVANTRALESAGIGPATPDPPGGTIARDPAGAPTGLLLEAAQDLVWRIVPPLSGADIGRALAQAGRQILGYGITTICEALLGVSHPQELTIWSGLLSGPWEGPRVEFLADPDAVQAALAARLPLAGTKLFADGVVTGRTAALWQPFEGTPEAGMLIHEPDELTGLVRDSTSGGLAVGIHAMGDRGIAAALDAIERAGGPVEPGGPGRAPAEPGQAPAELGQAPAGARPRRHRIEHCSLPAPESLARMRELGVVPVPQPVFLFAEGEAYLEQLGRQRCQRAYPLRAMIDGGLRPALSSDAPCTSWDDPINPWLGIATAVTRRTWAGSVLGTTEAISVGEAMLCYTANAAFSLGLERRTGAIQAGRDADLVVLPQDPFAGDDPARLAGLRPTAVLIGGKVVHGALR
ncbi:MAG TPA: amidohydrolase [Streptosporangiaceae bacterium]|nr:amidohydrolase [Streptosporangiaceae bacterium]